MGSRSTVGAEGPVHVSRVIESLGPLFEVPPDMIRHPDHPTSIEAARNLLASLRDLQARVLTTVFERGPMTDEELESLPEFRSYSPSTVRKRRSELVALKLLIATGEYRPNRAGTARMTIWDLWRR